jgi:hypothetical protein
MINQIDFNFLFSNNIKKKEFTYKLSIYLLSESK